MDTSLFLRKVVSECKTKARFHKSLYHTYYVRYSSLYLKNDLPAINARIEKLRAECEELVAKWQKSFMQTNSKIVSVFGEDGFGRYILQSLVGDINGNVFKSMQNWQDRNMMKLQQMTDIVNNLKP